MPVTWSDEKLILLYCPGRGSNSRPSAHRGFKHGQGVLRSYPLGHGGGYPAEGYGKKYEGSFLEKSQSGCVQNFCHFVCLHHFWA